MAPVLSDLEVGRHCKRPRKGATNHPYECCADLARHHLQGGYCRRRRGVGSGGIRSRTWIN